MSIQSNIIEVAIQNLPNQVVDVVNFAQIGCLVDKALFPKEIKTDYLILDSEKLDSINDPSEAIKNAFSQEFLGQKVKSIFLIGVDPKAQDLKKEIANKLESVEKEKPGEYFLLTHLITLTKEEVTELSMICKKYERAFISFYDSNTVDQDQLQKDLDALRQAKDLSSVIAIYHHEPGIQVSLATKMGLTAVGGRAGTATMKLKHLNGFKAKKWTSSEIEDMSDKSHINVYYKESEHYSFITEGYMLDGTFFDTFFGLAYMKALLINNLRNTLTQERKTDLGFDARGYTIIKGSILSTLSPFVRNQFMTDEINIHMPEPSEINQESFAKRILDEISINIYLIPKIHKIKVSTQPKLVQEAV